MVDFAGMLWTYAGTYAPLEMKNSLNEMAQYAFGFYFSHVVIIVVVANFMFYIKEIDSRFKASEDTGYDDLPTLKEYRSRMEQEKATGLQGLKKGFLVENALHEVNNWKTEIESFAQKNPLSSIKNIIPASLTHRGRTSSVASRRGSVSVHGKAAGPLHSVPEEDPSVVEEETKGGVNGAEGRGLARHDDVVLNPLRDGAEV